MIAVEQRRDGQTETRKDAAFDDPGGVCLERDILAGFEDEPIEAVLILLPDDVLGDAGLRVDSALAAEVSRNAGSGNFDNEFGRSLNARVADASGGPVDETQEGIWLEIMRPKKGKGDVVVELDRFRTRGEIEEEPSHDHSVGNRMDWRDTHFEKDHAIDELRLLDARVQVP